MTNLKIKDIGIFQEIANNINLVDKIAPQLMKEVNKALEDLKRDLFTKKRSNPLMEQEKLTIL